MASLKGAEIEEVSQPPAPDFSGVFNKIKLFECYPEVCNSGSSPKGLLTTKNKMIPLFHHEISSQSTKLKSNEPDVSLQKPKTRML